MCFNKNKSSIRLSKLNDICYKKTKSKRKKNILIKLNYQATTKKVQEEFIQRIMRIDN
jgi:hypothetical protein